MIDLDEVKRELKRIKFLAHTKNKDPNIDNFKQAQDKFIQFQGFILDDISKTGDQRVRSLMKVLREFTL